MANLNNVQIIGRLGKDPETRYTTGGKAVTKFSVAVEGYVPKDSDKPKHTEWFNVVAFDRLAEVCAEYLGKGDEIYVQGELETREYEKDGGRRFFTELKMRNMQMLRTKSKAPPGTRAVGGDQPEAAQVPDFDDDIPF